jgi:hypothetical protein
VWKILASELRLALCNFRAAKAGDFLLTIWRDHGFASLHGKKQSLRKIAIAISAMAHSRTKQNKLNTKETHALDNLYYSSGSLAAWTGDLLHIRRFHPHPARDRSCRADH